MSSPIVSRRTLMTSSALALAGFGQSRLSRPALAFQTPVDGTVIPWSDQLAENPVPNVIVQQLDWATLDSWITPNDEFFIIKHYDKPVIDLSSWALKVSGLVSTPLTLSLADLQQRERAEVTFTIECSGNTGLPFFDGEDRQRGLGGHAFGTDPGRSRGAGKRLRGRLLGCRRWRPGARRCHHHRAFRAQHDDCRRNEPRKPDRLGNERRAAAPIAWRTRSADRPRLVRNCQREVAHPHRRAPTSGSRAISWPATM